MGHFSNGSQAQEYAAKYCLRCVHGDCCALWLVHMACETRHTKKLLNVLIPRDESGQNKECTMFVEAKE